MAVKTMSQKTNTGLYDAGWHELVISSAAYDTWKSPDGKTTCENKQNYSVSDEGDCLPK